jgi:tetratricopeptide (TPR) repeat protein
LIEVVGESTVEYAGTIVRLTRAGHFFLVALIATISTACAGCPRDQRPDAAPEAQLEQGWLGWAGCAAVVKSGEGAEPVCELGESRVLRVALPDGATDIVVRADDAPIDAGVQTNATRTVEVPADTERLVADATVSGTRRRAMLRIAPAKRAAWLEEAKALRASGDPVRAEEIATKHADAPDAEERAYAKGILARLALSRGHADAAFPLFREAIEIHRQHGRISDAVDDSFALAFALHQRSHRYVEARAALDAIAEELSLYPEGSAREPYYRGILAAETGDRRSALTLLRDAEQRARALGMARLERNARSALALEMQELGRARASLAVLRDLEREIDASPKVGTDAPTPCERVEVANNIGWGALLANEAAAADGEGQAKAAEDKPVEDARAPLERAVAVQGCGDAYVRSSALANLARLALDEHDLDRAAARLAEARAGVTEPRGVERIAWTDLEARVLLARGRVRDALKRFDEARALAKAAILPLPEWSALVGRAEALEALGRTKDAITALLSAEDVLDDATLLVPLGEGRAAFVADRSRSARAAIDLLVKSGRPLDAVRVGRRSRARVLASVERGLRLEHLSIEERTRWEDAVRAFRAARSAIDADAADDWKLAADALERTANARKERERELRGTLERAMAVLPMRTPRPVEPPPKATGATSKAELARALAKAGTLNLDIYPGRRRWLAFAVDEHDAIAYSVPEPTASADDLGRALFEPARARLDRAKRVVVQAYGAWRSVDVHALPISGQPLLARVPVVYGLALETPEQREPLTGGPAAIVGDPTGDLPSALAEANDVAAALGPRGPHKLLVRDAATSTAIADALRDAALVHYAGHAVFAGPEGWESALPLARGGRFTVGDILTLPPIGRRVVLTGCEAARSDSEAEGLGLAQAFALAGAVEVPAPVRPVADALAAKLARMLYTAPVTNLDLAARTALLALRDDEPEGDWAAFRVLSP